MINTTIRHSRALPDEHIVGVIFIIALFLPHGGYFYFVNPAVLLYLVSRYTNYKAMVGVKVLIVGTLLLSALGYLVLKGVVEEKPLFRAVMLAIMIAAFPFVKNVRLPNFYLYFGIGFIFLSQVAYVLGISPLINFFSVMYPYEGESIVYGSEYLAENADQISIMSQQLRLGGMFHNPNQCARYLTILYAVFLIENRGTKSLLYPVTLVTLIAILYTGSRTGMAVFGLLFVFKVIADYIKKPSFGNTAVGIAFVSALGWGVFNYSDFNNLSEARSIDFTGAFDKSFVYKLKFFSEYLEAQGNFWNILFGCFDLSLVHTYIQSADILDSEWGNAFFAYGSVFVFGMIVFYIRVFRGLQSGAKIYFLLLLWMISSSLLFSYRASFVFMLILSKYFDRRKSSILTKKTLI